MGFFLTFFWFAASTVLSAWLKPTAKGQIPSGQDMTPTTNEGQPVSVVYGSCLIEQPVILYAGEFAASRDGKGSRSYIAGDVQLGAHIDLLLCHGPVDTIEAIIWDDILVGITAYWDGTGQSLQTGPLVLQKDHADCALYKNFSPSLWGNGLDSGINGTWLVYKGTGSQRADYVMRAYQHSFDGITSAQYPDYQGLCHVVMSGKRWYNPAGNAFGGSSADDPSTWTWGAKPGDTSDGTATGQLDDHFWYGSTMSGAQIKPIKFVIGKYPNTLGVTSGHEKVTYSNVQSADANPVCCLWDLLTNTTYGAGMPTSYLNQSQWVTQGETCYSEGLGISLLLDQRMSLEQAVAIFLKHMDATLQFNAVTGLLELKLIRADYTWADLPVFDESSVQSCQLQRGTLEDTSNEIRILYKDRSNNFGDRTMFYPNDANIAQRNGDIVPFEARYEGCTNMVLANMLANRCARALSYPLTRGTLTLNRKGMWLRPGDVFRLQWADYGEIDFALRVLAVRGGDLDKGYIEIDCVEDVFGIGHTAYPVVTTSGGYNEPAPVAISVQTLIQLPQMEGFQKCAFWALAGKPEDSLAYRCYSKDTIGGADYRLTSGACDYTPVGEIISTVLDGDTSMDIQEIAGLVPTLSTLPSISNAHETEGLHRLAMIEDTITGNQEWVAFDTVTPNSDASVYTVQLNTFNARGCLDSAPRNFGSGNRVWFPMYGHGLVSLGNIAPDQTYSQYVKLVPFNRRMDLDLASSTAMVYSVTVNNRARAWRPWCPAAPKTNGNLWALVKTHTGNLTWNAVLRDASDPRAYVLNGHYSTADGGNDPRQMDTRLEIYGTIDGGGHYTLIRNFLWGQGISTCPTTYTDTMEKNDMATAFPGHYVLSSWLKMRLWAVGASSVGDSSFCQEVISLRV